MTTPDEKARYRKDNISIERARELFRYEPESGRFFWVKGYGKRKVGDEVAERLNEDGYFRHFIDGRHYYMHRVAWLLMTGAWPDDQVDHINGIKNDNRWVNLRSVSNAVNQQNTYRPRGRTGFTGVTDRKKDANWQVNIRYGGKQHCLGSFATPEEAHEAYLRAKREHHEGSTI